MSRKGGEKGGALSDDDEETPCENCNYAEDNDQLSSAPYVSLNTFDYGYRCFGEVAVLSEYALCHHTVQLGILRNKHDHHALIIHDSA